ncbi:MAG: N-acetyltransferase [Candidatus Omnitrophota bacterium]
MLRKAKLTDAKEIHRLVNFFAKKDLMMPRSLNEIFEHLRDFWVATERGKVVGCCALHVVGWEDLAEIKSLAVESAYQKRHLGRKLVQAALKEAKVLGIKKIFALTYVPQFFARFNFAEVDKATLPQKIWAECCNCPKFPDCGEIAVMKKI